MRSLLISTVTLFLTLGFMSMIAADRAVSQNLVLNPGFESVSAGDGLPDHWLVAGGPNHPADWGSRRAKGKVSLSSDTHSGRFSLLYVSPKPYDWHKDNPGDPWDFTSWQESRKNPDSKFYYSVPVVSEEFKIEYPKVYRVSAWVRAENIAGLHIKFIGVAHDGTQTWFSPALRSPEGYYGKTGSWNWEKWEGIIIANRGNGWKGRIEAWMRENMTDGRFWLDDVSVEEVDHAGRGVEPAPRGVAALPPAIAKPGGDGTLQASGPKVQDTPSSVTISFRNGCTVVFSKDATGRAVGIREVSVHGKSLRQPANPIQPLVETESGGRYTACRFLACEQKDGKVIIRTQLVGKDAGATDSLDWIIAPADLDVYEKKYVGFSYSYRFESALNPAIGIWDRASWELGGRADGLSLREPGATRFLAFTEAMSFEGSPVVPFLSAPCFDFQARSGDGILLGFFDGFAHVETWPEKRWGEDGVRCLAHHTFTSSKQVQTVPRCIVFSECGALAPLQLEDEFTWALDALKKKYRALVGLKELPLLPTVRLHPHATGGMFEKYIPLLPDAKRLGFDVVMLDPIWESLDEKGNRKPGTCSITGLDVAADFGGEPGLKKLAEAVHAQGMKLITWAPTGLNRHDSQLLQDHPDWICRLPDGAPRPYAWNAYLPGRELTYLSLNSGYADYSLARYRHMRREIGLDGFWQDSFHALGQLHFLNPKSAVSNLLPGIKRQAQLQEIGLEFLDVEGYGPFGNEGYSAPGGILVYAGRQLYKTSPYYYVTGGPDAYYRAIANKCMPNIPYYRSKHPYWVNRNIVTNPYLEAEVAQANRDYALVRDKMARRFLIPSESNPWQEIGVLWSDGRGAEEVLFAYGDFQWPVGQVRSVKDVTTGETVALPDGKLPAQRKHTYLITR